MSCLKNKKTRIVKSRDNVEYKLTVFEDIVTLNDRQVRLIEKKIKELNSSEVESSKGIPIFNIPFEQSSQVIKVIQEILKEFSTIEEIVKSGIIDSTSHAELERKSDVEICIERDWDPEAIDYEIAESIKRSYSVDQIRIRFDRETKESWPKLGFTILGLKGGKRVYTPAKLVIYFDDDPIENDKTIMVITILKSEFAD